MEAEGCTVNVFENGCLLVMGARSLDDAGRAVEAVSEMLRGLGAEPEISPLAVVRVSVHGSMGRPVNLEKAARRIPSAVYEPELSTALSYADGGTSVILNSTGTALVSSEDEASA